MTLSESESLSLRYQRSHVHFFLTIFCFFSLCLPSTCVFVVSLLELTMRGDDDLNSVLRVYLGMVLHSNKRYLDALDMLKLASNAEPSNPQVM